jgi:hypothetical protein
LSAHTLSYGSRGSRRALVMSALDVLAETLRQNRTVIDVVASARRYKFLGFELDLEGVSESVLEGVRAQGPAILPLLDRMKTSSIGVELSPVDVAYLSLDLKISCQDVVGYLARLGPLGVQLAPDASTLLAAVGVTTADLCILSRELDGHPPWWRGKIPPVHLLFVSKQFCIPIRSLMERFRQLESLGIQVTPVDPGRLEALDPQSIRLLSRDLDGQSPWIKASVLPRHMARVADQFAISMVEARRELEKLAWTGIVLPSISADVLETLARKEPHFIRVVDEFSKPDVDFSDISSMHIPSDVPFADVTRISACLLPTPLRDALASLDPQAELTQDDVTILAAFETVPARDPETRRRRGRKWARFQIWQPSPAEFDATLARLAPVIDVIVQQPRP